MTRALQNFWNDAFVMMLLTGVASIIGLMMLFASLYLLLGNLKRAAANVPSMQASLPPG